MWVGAPQRRQPVVVPAVVAALKIQQDARLHPISHPPHSRLPLAIGPAARRADSSPPSRKNSRSTVALTSVTPWRVDFLPLLPWAGFMRVDPGRGGGLGSAMPQIGWGMLADGPGQEIVLGAVTRPWEPNPAFRSVPSAEFATFSEPGVVKIAFTFGADPVGEGASILRTETRAMATDAQARRLFRRYWTLVSPGVALIRLAMLKPVKIAAERHAGARLRGVRWNVSASSSIARWGWSGSAAGSSPSAS